MIDHTINELVNEALLAWGELAALREGVETNAERTTASHNPNNGSRVCRSRGNMLLVQKTMGGNAH